MAEERKSERAPKAEKRDPKQATVTIVSEIIVIALLLYLVSFVLNSFTRSGGIGGAAGGRFGSFQAFFDSFGVGGLFEGLSSTYIFFASLLSMLFIFGIVYVLLRLHTLEREWKRTLFPEGVSMIHERPRNERWDRVLKHISSDNPSDWRLAILECDILLDELLDKEGYVGNTIGDKLKSADPADFRTLNNAWEAHKIRNAIAHEGHDFTLTEREARRIVGLYESVFREFDYITMPEEKQQDFR